VKEAYRAARVALDCPRAHDGPIKRDAALLAGAGTVCDQMVTSRLID
jgi:hypothetical protein